MLTFKEDKGVFNYRVGGVFLNSGKILLHRSELDNFWSLPGGRCDLFENSQETILREMMEEIGVKVKIDRLLWIVENFFDYDSHKYHEIAFYYFLNFDKGSKYYIENSFNGLEDDLKLEFKWFDINELTNLPIYPSFIKNKIKNISENIEHIIWKD